MGESMVHQKDSKSNPKMAIERVTLSGIQLANKLEML